MASPEPMPQQRRLISLTLPTGKIAPRAWGYFGAAFGMGFVLGPAIGAWLIGAGQDFSEQLFHNREYGTSWAAFGAAFFSFVSWVLVLFWLPESKDIKHGQTHAYRGHLFKDLSNLKTQPRLLEIIGTFFANNFAFVFLETTFVYLCFDRFALKEKSVGYIYAYMWTITGICAGRTGWPANQKTRRAKNSWFCADDYIAGIHDAGGCVLYQRQGGMDPVICRLRVYLPGTGADRAEPVEPGIASIQ